MHNPYAPPKSPLANAVPIAPDVAVWQSSVAGGRVLCYGLAILSGVALIVVGFYTSQFAYPLLLTGGIMFGLGCGLPLQPSLCSAINAFDGRHQLAHSDTRERASMAAFLGVHRNCRTELVGLSPLPALSGAACVRQPFAASGMTVRTPKETLGQAVRARWLDASSTDRQDTNPYITGRAHDER